MKLLRVTSVRGVPYDKDAVQAFFQDLEKGIQKEFNYKPLMLSATCGDIQGYFTLLIGVDGMDREMVEKLGRGLAFLTIGNYDILEDGSYDKKDGQWIMTAVNKEETRVN